MSAPNDPSAREAIADILAAKLSGPVVQDWDIQEAHRQDQLAAADAILAVLAPRAPSPVVAEEAIRVALWNALKQRGMKDEVAYSIIRDTLAAPTAPDANRNCSDTADPKRPRGGVSDFSANRSPDAGKMVSPTAPDAATDSRLLNLLAVIHRDGGHYVAEHGTDRACTDAETQVVALNAFRDAHAQPPAGASEVERLIAELTPLVEKASGPNGWDWMFPLRVRPVDGKPTIVSNKGGNLFRGYIATWDEADLLVALANAAPRILAALAAREPVVEVGRS